MVLFQTLKNNQIRIYNISNDYILKEGRKEMEKKKISRKCMGNILPTRLFYLYFLYLLREVSLVLLL